MQVSHRSTSLVLLLMLAPLQVGGHAAVVEPHHGRAQRLAADHATSRQRRAVARTAALSARARERASPRAQMPATRRYDWHAPSSPPAASRTARRDRASGLEAPA